MYLCKFIEYSLLVVEMKRFVLLEIMLLLLTLQWETVQGQSYTMSDGQTITTCSGTFYDPGGPNSNYSNSLNVTQTIVAGSPNSCLQVTFTSFELESTDYSVYDYLQIYDGNSTSSPLIGTYSGTYSPGVVVSTSGVLTFVFHSDGSVNRPGWAANISCFDCSQYYTNSVTNLYLCPDSSSLEITANNAQSYSWSTGATTQSITVSTTGIYTVTLTNASGTVVDAFRVSDILMNEIANIYLPDMCAGDSYAVTVGHDSSNNFMINTHEAVETWTDTVFLPDGVYCEPYGCSYKSPLTFTSFSDEDVITSANDILYVRLNIEHSYIGDLYINLTCPNGQKADILRYRGNGSSSCSSSIPSSSIGWQSGSNTYGSTYFGQAYDYYSSSSPCNQTLSTNAPGYGWNYCWSNNTTEGFTYAPGAGSLVYRSVNAHSHPSAFPTTYGGNVTIVDSSNVTAGTQFYHPDQSFSSLIGCPLNGNWYIEVMDGYSVDNGYLFEWELALTSDVQSEYTDVVSTTLEGPWVEKPNDTTYVISPPETLSHDTTVTYIFSCFNEYGCEYDTAVFINFYPENLTIKDTTVCDSFFWNDSLYTQSFTHNDTLTNIHACDSIVTFQVNILYSSQYEYSDIVCDSLVWNDSIYYESGDYTYLTQSVEGCDSLVTLHLTVRKSCQTDIYDSACNFFVWNDITYYSSGEYVQHFQNQYTCDSMVTLHLTIFNSDSIVVPVIVCDKYIWDDSTYYESGEYERIYQNIHGCDSLVTLKLTILTSEDTAVYQTACDSLSWDDVTYYGSGDYVIPLVKLNGCDSMVTLHFTIWRTDYINVYDTSCNSYEWHGVTYYESGNYQFNTQNEHGCDSIVTLHLTIHHSDYIDLYDSACDIFSWNDSTYYESGNYVQYFQNVYNCDSVVTLHLDIWNSDNIELYDTVCDSLLWNDSIYYEPGDYTFLTQNQHGCDSLVTLHLDVHYSDWVEIYDTTCDVYVWNDSVYDETGVYQQYFQNQYGCDSTVTLHLVVRYSNSEEVIETECDSFVWNDSMYYESGDYIKHFLNISGCDSIVTLHLTIRHSNFTELYDTVCDSFDWNDSLYEESGDYQQIFLNTDGCDSTVLRHLVVHYTKQTDIYDTACDSYDLNDITYYESGNYFQYFQSVDGCDSIVALHLTIFNSHVIDEYKAACDSLIWNDSIYYESGVYEKYFQNVNGCDSTVVLHLVIMSTTPITQYESACDSLVWNDSIYYESGVYIQVFPSVEGCDSVVTLHLTVTNTNYSEESLSACDSLEWNGSMYYESGDYTTTLTNQEGCDSVVTLHLNLSNSYYVDIFNEACDSLDWYDSIYYESGDYTIILDSEEGCDSVVTLHLTVHASTDTLISIMVYENSVPYSMNGYEYYTEGIYSQTLTNAAGCDSLITLQFSIFHPVSPLSVLTYEVNNSHCDGIPGSMDTSVACNGYAFVVASGGVPPYAYQWDDPLAQQTDTALLLCAGQYTVTVTDVAGDTAIAVVTISDYVPKVEHDDAHFCFSDSSAVLQGTPAGGVYTGAPMNGNTLVFQENVTDYLLTYTYTTEHSCSASVQFQVTVTMNTRTEDTVICSSYLPYVWYGQSLYTSGTYQKTTPMDTLCDSLIVLHFNVIQQPQLTVGEDVVIDPGEHTTLSASGAGSYEWTPAASLSSASLANPVASPTQSTKYHVTGFVTADCYSTDSVKVLIRNHSDTIVCENALPFEWHGLTISDTSTRVVTIPSPDGLDKVYVLHTQLLPNTFNSIQDTVMENDLPLVFNGIEFYQDVTDTMIVIPNSHGCDSVITFSLYVCRNQAVTMDSVVCESDLPLLWNNQELYEENTYQVDLQSVCGSDSTVILNLSVIDTALKIISNTPDFCMDMYAELEVVSNMTDYLWSTGEQTMQITVTHPGIYSVTASQGNCQVSANFVIQNCDYQLILPNAFSPNMSEGLNDYFCIPEAYLKLINLFEISIFNRWGQLVFYSTDKNFKWNGEYKGQILPNATYNYIIRYTSESGTPYVVKGSVTVL